MEYSLLFGYRVDIYHIIRLELKENISQQSLEKWCKDRREKLKPLTVCTWNVHTYTMTSTKCFEWQNYNKTFQTYFRKPDIIFVGSILFDFINKTMAFDHGPRSREVHHIEDMRQTPSVSQESGGWVHMFLKSEFTRSRCIRAFPR